MSRPFPNGGRKNRLENHCAPAVVANHWSEGNAGKSKTSHRGVSRKARRRARERVEIHFCREAAYLNWEFLGSVEAGPRAAVLFTILAGAKRHRLEPWAYVRDILLRLSAGETDLEALLPDRWAANHPEKVLKHRLDESRRKATRKKETLQRRRAKATKNA
jgi:hypothetical protein